MSTNQILQDIEGAVGRLTPDKRLVFGLLLLDRMLPNFVRFALETGAVGVGPLNFATSALWEYLEVGGAGKKLPITSEQCELLIPESEDFSSIYTASAGDAAAALASLVEYVGDYQTAHLNEIVGLARDSVDIFIQLKFDLNPQSPAFEETIRNYPLMRSELAMQIEDLAFLEGFVGTTRELVACAWLRMRGRLSIGLE